MKILFTSLAAWLRPKPLRMRSTAARRPALAVAAGLAMTLLGSFVPADSLRSDLFIEPAQQFVLGGDQRGEFRVVAKNVGSVPVEFKERPRGRSLFGKGTLAPGRKVVLRFAAGSTALLRNPNAQQAHLNLTVTGDIKLRMDNEPVPPGAQAANSRLTTAELSDALANWSGTLTYLNYSSPKTVVLNTTVRGEMTSAQQLVLRFDYEEPNKSHVFGTDTLAVAPDGARLRWDGAEYVVQSKQRLPAHTLRLVLEAEGRDNDQPATIRKTLTLSPHQFLIRKEVRYRPEAAFFERNRYQFTR